MILDYGLTLAKLMIFLLPIFYYLKIILFVSFNFFKILFFVLLECLMLFYYFWKILDTLLNESILALGILLMELNLIHFLVLQITCLIFISPTNPLSFLIFLKLFFLLPFVWIILKNPFQNLVFFFFPILILVSLL